ncbi:MAG: hypothetical protein WBD34_08030, partial [Burkholderiaceae bacterium]
VTGTLNANGANNVTIFADDGQHLSEASFVWTVTDPNAADTCNLLDNGSFEAGTSGWSSSVSPGIVSDAAVGASAARFSGGWISVTVPGAPTTEYSFNGQYQSQAGSGWSGFGIDYLDSAGSEIGEEVQTLNSASGYTHFVLSATSPANTASLRIWFYADTGRQLTLDSVELRKAGCTGGETSGGTCNVVSNSGFEVNTAGWYTNTIPILTTQAAEGNQAARISDGWISHITPVVPGTTYTASALVKSVGNNGWSGTGLNFVDSNGVKLANVVQTIPPGNQYETVTLTSMKP